MELKLNLFVHGVPKGQKIWGPQEDDRVFLESFYSRKPNVETQLQVDIFQIGRKLNCYYTYLIGGNLLDKDNRQGSYFALTIRVNAFYNDLFNIYNILDATYNKFILKSIIARDESSTRFIVEDFQQSDRKFQEIEKEIINYLSSFSNSSDFISLDNFTTTAKSESPNINLLECNDKSVLNYIKGNGKISISPFYPSMQFIEFSRKKDEEIRNFKFQAQQQIAEEKKKFEQDILEIKNEYDSADKTISDLRKQLEIEKSNFSSLKSELFIKDEQLNKFRNLKQKFDIKEQELIKVNNIFSAIKQLLVECNVRSVNIESNKLDTPIQEVKRKKSKFEKLNTYLPLINTFLTIITILIVLYSFFKIHPFQNKDIEKKDIHGSTSFGNTQGLEIKLISENFETRNYLQLFSQTDKQSQNQIEIRVFKNSTL